MMEQPAPSFEPRQLFDPRQKSPRLAAILSVAPGLGQVYVGYYTRGFLLGGVFLMLLMVANNAPYSLEPIPGMATFFFWLFNVIDAGRLAALYNHAASGTELIQMPENFQMPSTGGSIVGGAILVLFGVVALSNTLLGLSLDWIESWWPVFPLAVGAYLLAKGIQDHSKVDPSLTRSTG
ncbi:MAG TPA: hypothetical protein QGG47_08485 [Acidobacteriota bacterium]|nr:hypothetical protein [Acidobacteriota bacterium]